MSEPEQEIQDEAGWTRHGPHGWSRVLGSYRLHVSDYLEGEYRITVSVADARSEYHANRSLNHARRRALGILRARLTATLRETDQLTLRLGGVIGETPAEIDQERRTPAAEQGSAASVVFPDRYDPIHWSNIELDSTGGTPE
jgi:hypothetical protein